MEYGIDTELKRVDEAIRAGRTEEARTSLSAIGESDLPRESLAEFCSLCRRVGELARIIRLLNPIVRPSARRVSDASPHEIVEYAGALVRSGILTEAEALLSSVDPKKVPRALLIASFAAIARWDSTTSNAKLQQFLAFDIDLYERRIAEVNLLQGHVFLGARDEARAMIAHLLRELTAEQSLLRAAVYEFAAEIARVDGQRKVAREMIEKGLTLLPDARTIDELLLRKQNAINEAWFTRETQILRDLREEAVERRHVESVRDCDLFIALIEKDEQLLRKVYFGSASVHYKKRVERLSRRPFPELKFARYPSRPGLDIQLERGQIPVADLVLKRGQALHRLLKTLLSDHYKPFRKLDLFEAVFPGEIYIPAQSSDRMHQLIKRLRQALVATPISIIEKKGVYRIEVEGAYTLNFGDSLPAWAKAFRHSYSRKWFTIGDFVNYAKVSERTAHRRLGEIRQTCLEEKGRTKSLKFRFR